MSVMLFVFKDRIFLTCRVHRPVENNRPKKQRDLNNYRETTLSVCPCQENIFQLSSSPEFPTPQQHFSLKKFSRIEGALPALPPLTI